MDIFVAGHQDHNLRRMLFGLEVLRGASEAQVQTAMRFVHATRRLPVATITAMFQPDQPPHDA